jgi:hypothetical protein
MIGAGAPIGAAGPSPGQVWPAVASCGQLWPATASSGLATAGCGAAGPSQVRPALHHCFGAAF